MGLLDRLTGSINMADTITRSVNCIRWENPFVWLLLPFWLPLLIVMETVALIVLWTIHDQTSARNDRQVAPDQDLDDGDEDEDGGQTLIDIDGVKSLFLAVMMLPLLIPAAMIRVIVNNIKHSRFRLTPTHDPQIYSYKSWKFQRKAKRRLTFARKD